MNKLAFQATYKGKKIGKEMGYIKMREMNACFLNLDWRPVIDHGA